MKQCSDEPVVSGFAIRPSISPHQNWQRPDAISGGNEGIFSTGEVNRL
jgi:hypothetical protein